MLPQPDRSGSCQCAQHVCVTSGVPREDGQGTNIKCKGAIFTQTLWLCVCLLGDRDSRLLGGCGEWAMGHKRPYSCLHPPLGWAAGLWTHLTLWRVSFLPGKETKSDWVTSGGKTNNHQAILRFPQANARTSPSQCICIVYYFCYIQVLFVLLFTSYFSSNWFIFAHMYLKRNFLMSPAIEKR